MVVEKRNRKSVITYSSPFNITNKKDIVTMATAAAAATTTAASSVPGGAMPTKTKKPTSFQPSSKNQLKEGSQSQRCCHKINDNNNILNNNKKIYKKSTLSSSKKHPRKYLTKIKMNGFSVGQQVEIKRSDGRVHGAIVVGFDEEDHLVKVEWYEEGETKGKEIDYRALIKMNAISNPFTDALSEQIKKVPTVVNKLPPPPTSKPLTRIKTQQTTASKVSTTIDPKTMRSVISEKDNGKNGGISNSNKTLTRPKTETTKTSREKENYEPSSAIEDSMPSNPRSTSVIRESHAQREERKVKNSETKRKKYISNEIDKSSSNWQFLSMINEYRSSVDFRPISPSDDILDNDIYVCIRKRPLDKRELSKKEIDVVTVPNKDHVVVHQPQTKVDLTKYLENQKFRFDYAFDEDCDNKIVYRFTAQPLIKTVFEGGYATVFAYGQTGSGKTHTMSGAFQGKTQDYTAGIYALTAEDVFRKLNNHEYQKMKMTIKCSFFEIYGSKVFDLLGKRAELRILEDGQRSVQIVGLSEVAVSSPEDVMELIKQGSTQRSAGTTSANANSSRSHAVFQFILRRGAKEEVHGKFSLIDLAGNERGADTNSSDKQTRREGAEINKSLLALKECIRAMAMNKTHLPFRYSKLTLVLRDSFNNQNAKTCMIGMVSPGLNSVENTLNTLRYADRVKELGSDEYGPTKPMADADFMIEDDEDDYEIVVKHQQQPKLSPTKNNKKNIHQNQRQQSQNSDDYNNLDDNLPRKIRDAEEKAFEDHHALLTICDEFEVLMQSQSDTENDVEKYAKHLIASCERGTEAMSHLKDSAKDLLNKIQKEREQTRKKTTRK